MLRYRAVEARRPRRARVEAFLSGLIRRTDTLGKANGLLPWLVNVVLDRRSRFTRWLVERTLKIDRRAVLPRAAGTSFLIRMRELYVGGGRPVAGTARLLGPKAPEAPVFSPDPDPGPPQPSAGASLSRAAGAHVVPFPSREELPRHVVFYTSCYGNYNEHHLGEAALYVLAHHGVEVEILYDECCGMPQLEGGELAVVSQKAQRVASRLEPWIDRGYAVVAPVPSCSLMFKKEWPLLVPEDKTVAKLAKASYDLSEYIVALAKAQARTHSADAVSVARAPEEASSSSPRVALHISCHSRAQNMGRKAEELLRLIPGIQLKVVERCSGHGGSWGIMKENWQTGMRVGRLNFQQMNDEGRSDVIISECPLAGLHIEQGLESLREGQAMPERLSHPVVLLARSYGWHPA